MRGILAVPHRESWPMRARISLIGCDLIFRSDAEEQGAGLPIKFNVAGLARLKDWTLQYKRSVHLDDPAVLAAFGTAIFDGFDAANGLTTWQRGMGDRRLEVAVDHAGTEAALCPLSPVH
jgi:hypothetical protein